MSDDELTRFASEQGKGLLRFAALIAPPGMDPQDLIQDCLIRVAPRLAALNESQAVAYSRRVIVNMVIDEHRRQQRRDGIVRLLARDPRPAGMEDAVTNRVSLIALVRRLPPRQRAAVVLRYWGGLGEPEIAETLGCSRGTVKSQISRALSTLRTATDHALQVGDGHD